MELAACQLSGTSNFEVASIFLVNLQTHYTQLYRVACVATNKHVNNLAHQGSII
jgi:hypothetical protein